MEFWSDLITRKSWDVLLKLKEMPVDFILIGGWAAFLWTRLHKSKDIDIVLENHEALAYFKQHFDLKKNTRLKNYEITIEEVDVDIYVPYFSELSLPVEEIIKHKTVIENIAVAAPEALLILKQGAEKDRSDSIKGRKDQVDILTLVLNVGIDWKKYHQLLKQHNLEHYLDRLKGIITHFQDIKYLELNPRQFKLKKVDVLEKLNSL